MYYVLYPMGCLKAIAAFSALSAFSVRPAPAESRGISRRHPPPMPNPPFTGANLANFRQAVLPSSQRGRGFILFTPWIICEDLSQSPRRTSRWTTRQKMMPDRQRHGSGRGLAFRGWSMVFSSFWGLRCYGHGKLCFLRSRATAYTPYPLNCRTDIPKEHVPGCGAILP